MPRGLPNLEQLRAFARRVVAAALHALDPGLAAILLAFAALQLRHAGFVPIWDTSEYAECILDAVRANAGPAAFNCAGHPSMAYLYPLGLSQHLFYGSTEALHAVNLLLGAIAIAAFLRLARRALPADRVLALLATAAFALLPMVNGNLLDWTPDYGVLVFFLPLLAALVEARMIAALAWGTALVFSKESGALLYGLAAAGAAILLPEGAGWRNRLKSLEKRWVHALPAAAWLFFLLGKSAASGGGSPFWRGTAPQDIVRSLFTVTLDRLLASHAAGLFVISFDWLATIACLFGAVAGVVGLVRRGAADEPARTRLFLGAMLVAGFYALTRFRTFSHPRYLLALHPLLVLCAAASLGAIVRRAAVRRGLAAAFVVLVAVSNFRTLDPVSRRVYGTFRFGDHPMLKITSIAGECCGDGLDGLTYNLEYARIHDLSNRLFADQQPRPPALVAMAEWSHWWMVNRLDDATCRRTLRRTGAFSVVHAGVEPGRPPPPGAPSLLFVEYPQMDPATALGIVSDRYRETGRREYEQDGYRIAARTFVPK